MSRSYCITFEFATQIKKLRNGRAIAPGQAIKSVGRMTWHQEPTKDVTSCDKLRLGANIHRPADFRMGKPDKAIPYHCTVNP